MGFIERYMKEIHKQELYDGLLFAYDVLQRVLRGDIPPKEQIEKALAYIGSVIHWW